MILIKLITTINNNKSPFKNDNHRIVKTRTINNTYDDDNDSSDNRNDDDNDNNYFLHKQPNRFNANDNNNANKNYNDSRINEEWY